MAESRINSRGRTTVPAAVRKALSAKPGARLVWQVMPDGCVLVRAKSRSILELAGILKSGVSVDIEDMNPWRD
ncbi:AbrB/MazE/SpoVT family DNA-binding domain-containing protein [Paraburkholderia sediminicola]|uniref:AbrB/MazE/SpoVT family DNA-binding domain-containing protein n=1 Tax=Paraburkholderia sediminicola TaxID=458836 RepID=UPI0038BB74E1